MINSRFLFVKLQILFGFLVLFISSMAQPEKVEIIPVKVTDQITMLLGQGGNIGLFTGPDGAFLIDDQYAPLSKKIKSAINSITDKDVRFLINTHFHQDHTGGNENFGNDGAIIVAHENVRKRLIDRLEMLEKRELKSETAEIGLPVISFSTDINFHLNGEDVMVFHVHQAHTDGDAIIYFPKSNVLHTGDIFFNGSYPFIDLNAGGTISGVLEAVGKCLFLTDDETLIIPGHGELGNKTDLVLYQNMLKTIKSRIAEALLKGMDLEQLKEANLTEEFDDSWGKSFINGGKFTEILYNDLSKSTNSM